MIKISLKKVWVVLLLTACWSTESSAWRHWGGYRGGWGGHRWGGHRWGGGLVGDVARLPLRIL